MKSLAAIDGGTGILFGHLYEHFAHQVIPHGGDFRIRNLETNEISVLHLDVKATKKLRQKDDLPRLEITEYGHGHETFPAIDAVTRDPPDVFNMTVNRARQRGLNGLSLFNIFTHLSETHFPRPCPYYWVILPNRFDRFKKQSITDMNRAQRDLLILQFVLELDIVEPTPQQTPTKHKNQGPDREDNKTVKV